jgi:hypothetical protein
MLQTIPPETSLNTVPELWNTLYINIRPS